MDLRDQVESGEITGQSLSFNLSELVGEDYDALQHLIRRGVIEVRTPVNFSWIEKLSYDNFTDLVGREITGNDVISLCQSSKHLESYCQRNNQELFKTLIVRDYHVRYQDLMSYYEILDLRATSPKEVYLKLSQVPEVKRHMEWRISLDPSEFTEWTKYRIDQEWRNYEVSQFLIHKDEMLKMVKDHYPPFEKQWVNYSLFYVSLMNDMANEFFAMLEDGIWEKNTNDDDVHIIDFRWILAFALISNNVDDGGDRAFDLIEKMDNAVIEISQRPPRLN